MVKCIMTKLILGEIIVEKPTMVKLEMVRLTIE
jgi:hypothetical protein